MSVPGIHRGWRETMSIWWGAGSQLSILAKDFYIERYTLWLDRLDLIKTKSSKNKMTYLWLGSVPRSAISNSINSNRVCVGKQI